MRRGTGPSLGRALINAFGVLRRPAAVSWHAQLAQLTTTGRGQEILARHATPGPAARKWRGWLARDVTPSKASRSAIADAYQAYLGRDAYDRPDHGRRAKIYGIVAVSTGTGKVDVRDRGAGGTAPLLIEHRFADWDEFDRALYDRDASAAATAYIYDVINADLNFSDPPMFPGPTYTVEIF